MSKLAAALALLNLVEVEARDGVRCSSNYGASTLDIIAMERDDAVGCVTNGSGREGVRLYATPWPSALRFFNSRPQPPSRMRRDLERRRREMR